MNKLSVKSMVKPAGLLLLFFLYASFYFITGPSFTSPDETANYHFANQYGDGQTFRISSSVEDHSIIHPRSVNVNADGDYVPVGFLGMPLFYGGLAKIFGSYSILFFPAFIAIIGIISFYLICAILFDRKTATIGAILLATLPPWWYYAARGYLPNVTFLSLLLASVASFLTAKNNTSAIKSILLLVSGILFAFALLVRPIEFIWVVVFILIAFSSLKKSVKLRDTAFFVLPIIFLLIYYFNLADGLYGNALLTGYDALSEGTIEQLSLFKRAEQLVFPFGIDIIGSFSKFWAYSIQLLSVPLIFTVIGLIGAVKSGVHKKYSVGLALISIYLIVYYGSWEIADHPDTSRVSIGISYMRYWLPIYILSIPFTVKGIEYVSSFSKKYRIVLGSVFLAFCLTWGGYIVYNQSDDNLGEIASTVVQYKKIQQKVVEQVEESAIIVSQRNDKVFWPIHEVIHFEATTDFSYLAKLGSVAEKYPLYWYTELPEEIIIDIERRFLQPEGIALIHTIELELSEKTVYLFKLDF
jgi:hypothetical protein